MTLRFASGPAGPAFAARPVAAQRRSARLAGGPLRYDLRTVERPFCCLPRWGCAGGPARGLAPRPGSAFLTDMMYELAAVPSARFDPEATCMSFRRC